MNKIRNNFEKLVRLSALCLALTMALVCSAGAEVDYVLMLQHTPSDGGTVSPSPGVHNVVANGDVTVIARPRPGYEFVTWLGEVADPTANSTTVSVNSPKIVVAVFQRSEYELPFAEPAPPDSTGGGSSLIPNRQYAGGGMGVSPNQRTGNYGGINYEYSPKYIYNPPVNPPTDDPGDDPPPIPNIPEPATMLLLGLGSVLALKRRK